MHRAGFAHKPALWKTGTNGLLQKQGGGVMLGGRGLVKDLMWEEGQAVAAGTDRCARVCICALVTGTHATSSGAVLRRSQGWGAMASLKADAALQGNGTRIRRRNGLADTPGCKRPA